MARIGRKEVDRNPGLFVPDKGEPTLVTDYVHQGFQTSITAHKPVAQGGDLQLSRTYDARGRLVETAQRVAGPGSNESVAQYLYDPAGALTNLRSGSRRTDGSWAINPASVDLVAEYDHLGRKTKGRIRTVASGRTRGTVSGVSRRSSTQTAT